MFTFTPLLGAQSTSNASQSILELDGGIKILIGTGWDEGFDPRQLVDLEKFAFLPIVHSPRKMEGFEY
jgi:cleavage and polyadenylation specificity factor subunit 2